MSLAIDLDAVKNVLIAGTWHEVLDETFDLDAYEFTDDDAGYLFGGGQSDLVCATGFRFKTHDGRGNASWLYGPLTSIQAVETR